ncbi:hypothetical protein WN51_09916 [Melipona quadrifasciata]|uniref:Uncharacterized protein n=1 Tax=Melipona quadrifasciata TaxID=166423 RepID=A0A0M9A9A3_9HYME|nr:hypothetical protein WN51_09916 [Melipona quadrifasciata]
MHDSRSFHCAFTLRTDLYGLRRKNILKDQSRLADWREEDKDRKSVVRSPHDDKTIANAERDAYLGCNPFAQPARTSDSGRSSVQTGAPSEQDRRSPAKRSGCLAVGSILKEMMKKSTKLLNLKIVRYGSQKHGDNGRDNQKHQEAVIVKDLVIRKHFPGNASQSMGWKNYSFKNSSTNLEQRSTHEQEKVSLNGRMPGNSRQGEVFLESDLSARLGVFCSALEQS